MVTTRKTRRRTYDAVPTVALLLVNSVRKSSSRRSQSGRLPDLVEGLTVGCA